MTGKPMTYGEYVREARLKRGWTQQELAVRSGRRESDISKIETGATQSPTFETVAKLAVAFGEDPPLLDIVIDRAP